MQKALADLDNDADFKADVMTSVKFIPRFLIGEKTAGLFYKSRDPGPKLRQFLQDYIAEGVKLANSHR